MRNHAFQIGSVTKSFVGVVCAQMHAEGILDPDACITNWLEPDLTAHFPNADNVTFVRAAARRDGLLNDAARQAAMGNWAEGKKGYFLGLQRARSGEGAPWFLGHSGGTPGYHCFAFHEPERDITIVYFGSSSLLTARGDQRLDKFYKTLRSELFEQAINESEQ